MLYQGECFILTSNIFVNYVHIFLKFNKIIISILIIIVIIIIQIKIWISYRLLSHNTDFEIACTSLFENYYILRYYIMR